MQHYPGRGRSRAAPFPAGHAASGCLHKAPPLLADEETHASFPSGQHMTGFFSEAPHHTLHPAKAHKYDMYLQMKTIFTYAQAHVQRDIPVKPQ